jgi:hypothetical protein
VELRLRERQPLGLTDMEGSQAVAFAFGSLHMWCASITCITMGHVWRPAHLYARMHSCSNTLNLLFHLACRERFSVFFACADGKSFVVVPFVPFGERALGGSHLVHPVARLSLSACHTLDRLRRLRAANGCAAQAACTHGGHG